MKKALSATAAICAAARRLWTFDARVKFYRIPAAILVAILVTGCAAPTRTGATLDTLTKNIGAPKAGHARVFVMRDKAFPGIIDAGWNVQLDGQTMGDLKTGTFVYLDRPTGRHQLTFFRAGDLAHVSRLDFDVAAGRSYYFRIELNDKGRAVAAGSSQGGILPLLVTSAVTAAVDDRGLFDFIPLDDAGARQAMIELRLADPMQPSQPAPAPRQ
jgi:hypothetical protein